VPGSHSPAVAVPHARRGRLGVFVAVTLFAALAATPLIRQELHLAPPRPPSTFHGVRLLGAPRSLPSVMLQPVAMPIDATAPLPPGSNVNTVREAAVILAEDTRLRILLHDSVRTYQPEVISVRGALPTLILPAGIQSRYTIKDLVQYGAALIRPNHTALVIDSIFVAANARLTITSGRNLRAIYLDSTPSGFASIVSWGGHLVFKGATGQPLTIMGWDHQLNRPATDRGNGRSYIRAVGGSMTLSNVRAAWLGFWSGRTGGVAWTGITTQPSTGGATDSTFTDDTYGAFASRTQNLRFASDLFEFNQLDGLHIHRYSVNTQISGSSAVRNGGSGFVVDRAAEGTVLSSDVSEHNGGDGFFVDGRPLVGGASPSGGAVNPGVGTRITGSAALGNAKAGILLEGGSGTVLRSDLICDRLTGIAVRYGATSTVVTGSQVKCGPRIGLEIGPNASDIEIAGVSVAQARIGMLVRNAQGVAVDNDFFSGAKVFGITVRGAISRVSGADNTISGTGFRAVDARADAPRPALYGTNAAGWAHHVKLTAANYLLFHPLAASWLGILLVVLLGAAFSRRRRLPPHPYPITTRWRHEPAQPAQPELAYASPSARQAPVIAGSAANGRPPGIHRATEVTASSLAAAPDNGFAAAPSPANAFATAPSPEVAWGRDESPAATPEPSRYPEPDQVAPSVYFRRSPPTPTWTDVVPVAEGADSSAAKAESWPPDLGRASSPSRQVSSPAGTPAWQFGAAEEMLAKDSVPAPPNGGGSRSYQRDRMPFPPSDSDPASHRTGRLPSPPLADRGMAQPARGQQLPSRAHQEVHRPARIKGVPSEDALAAAISLWRPAADRGSDHAGSPSTSAPAVPADRAAQTDLPRPKAADDVSATRPLPRIRDVGGD